LRNFANIQIYLPLFMILSHRVGRNHFNSKAMTQIAKLGEDERG